jgi:hypothetical protein
VVAHLADVLYDLVDEAAAPDLHELLAVAETNAFPCGQDQSGDDIARHVLPLR